MVYELYGPGDSCMVYDLTYGREMSDLGWQ